MVVSPGVHVSGISKNITQNQLESLFSKIHPVREVYIPTLNTPTGLYRNFAIVRFLFGCDYDEQQNAISDVLNKCVKSFNGSLWQGSKIKVSIAKQEYYDILRAKERQITTSSKEVNDDSIQTLELCNKCMSPICRDIPPILAIRKYSAQLPIKVSTKPFFSSSNINSETKETSSLDSRTLKTLSSSQSTDKPIFRGRRTVFVDSVDDTATIEHYQSMSTSIDITQIRLLDIGNNDKKDEVTQKLVPSGKKKDESAVPKIDGDGKAVATTQLKKPEGGGKRKGFGTLIQAEEATEKHLPSENSSQVGLPSQHTAVVQSGDTSTAPTNTLEDAYIDEYIDAQPCIPPSELQEQFLEQEKLRALSVLDMVLKKNPEHSSSSNKKQATASILKESIDKPHTQVVEPSITVVSSQQQQQPKQTQKKVGESAPGQEVQKLGENPASTQEQLQVAENLKPSDHFAKPIDTDHFADLGTLKNIFFKEGGVWWNDSNNDGSQAPKHVEKKISSMEGLYVGQVAQDPLFLEAEKLGLDIRDSGDGAKTEKTMLFSFFSSGDDKGGGPESMEIDNNDCDGGDERVAKKIKTVAMPEPARLEEVALIARKFCRDKSKALEEIKSEWAASREKLVLDYKRKRKEAKKRQSSSKTTRENNQKFKAG